MTDLPLKQSATALHSLLFTPHTLDEADERFSVIKTHIDSYYIATWFLSLGTLFFQQLNNELWLTTSLFFAPAIAMISIFRVYLNWCEYVNSYNKNYNLYLKLLLNTLLAVSGVIVAIVMLAGALGLTITYQEILYPVLASFYALKSIWKFCLAGYFIIQYFYSEEGSDRQLECINRAQKYGLSAIVSLCMLLTVILVKSLDLLSNMPKLILAVATLFISGMALISSSPKSSPVSRISEKISSTLSHGASLYCSSFFRTSPKKQVKNFTIEEILANPNRFNINDIINTLNALPDETQVRKFLITLINNQINRLKEKKSYFWMQDTHQKKINFLTSLKNCFEFEEECIKSINLLMNDLENKKQYRLQTLVFASGWEAVGKTEQIIRAVRAYCKKYSNPIEIAPSTQVL